MLLDQSDHLHLSRDPSRIPHTNDDNFPGRPTIEKAYRCKGDLLSGEMTSCSSAQEALDESSKFHHSTHPTCTRVCIYGPYGMIMWYARSL